MPTVEYDGVQSTDLDIEKEGIIFHMSLYTRARRLAVGVACFGGGLLGIATAPSAAAAGTLSCAATITGSGSSLQKVAQVSVFTSGFASTSCAKTPTVTYTATGSGAGLKEFGNGTEALAPGESGNKASLDGYVGTDDAPTPAQTNEASRAAGGGDQRELTIPVAEAPVAVLLNPPTGCVVEMSPNIPNAVLDILWQGGYASWDAFLEAANKIKHAGGACAEAPKLTVRSDGSGTSYVFKSYLAQIDSAKWAFYANDGAIWPASSNVVTETEIENPTTKKLEKVKIKGGSGEVKAVESAPGSIGYAAAADAAPKEGKGFGPWAGAAPRYWAEIQNNGSGEPAAYSDPASGSNGNCPTAVTPAGTPSAPGNWFGVLASNPNIGAAAGFLANQYSLCGLTYDLAWRDYALIGSYGSAPGPLEVGNAVADFLTYVTGSGQGVLATAGKFYSSLPTAVRKVAVETVAEVNNPSSGGGGGGGGGTTPPTTTPPTTPTTTPTTTPLISSKPAPTPVKAAETLQPLTKAQKLAKALKACKKKHKKQRASCERQAKQKYGRHAKKGHKKH